MKKIIMFMLIATLMLAVPIAADVNMTINRWIKLSSNNKRCGSESRFHC